MKETVINFDNKKRMKTLLLGAFIFLACLGFVYYLIFVASKIKIFYVAMAIVLAGMGLFMIIGGLRNILTDTKGGLLLNSEGFFFKGTPIARKIGLISWKDIESLSVGNAYNAPFIFLKLRNPEKYIYKISPQLQQNVIKQGVGITNNELSIGFDELKNLIEQYYTQCR